MMMMMMMMMMKTTMMMRMMMMIIFILLLIFKFQVNYFKDVHYSLGVLTYCIAFPFL